MNKISAIENSEPWPTVWGRDEEEFDISKHPYLFKGAFGFKNDVPIQVYKPETTASDPIIDCRLCGTELTDVPGIGSFCPNTQCTTELQLEESPEIMVEFVTVPETLLVDSQPKDFRDEVIADLLKIRPDGIPASGKGFGTEFPKKAKRGDVFVRVDVLPNTVHKYDGRRWNQLIKEQNDTYLHDESYIEYLIQKIDSGEYDVELLTYSEKDQIRDYLKAHPWNEKFKAQLAANNPDQNLNNP
jgi:hypothetical protein